MKILNATTADIFGNAKVKINPQNNKPYELLISGKALFKADGWERVSHPPPPSRGEQEEEKVKLEDEEENATKKYTSSSAKRAKRKMFDFILCNPLDVFFTLTLDPNLIDRYDYKAVINKFNRTMDNMVRRHDLQYVVTMELHKDGAIHFHGLCNSTAVTLEKTKKRTRRGQTIYNLTNWKHGFTTAVKVKDDDRERTANYIGKYITKQMENGKIGGRYFYHSSNLAKPIKEVYQGYFDMDELEENKVVNWSGYVPETGIRLQYVEKQNIEKMLEKLDKIG